MSTFEKKLKAAYQMALAARISLKFNTSLSDKEAMEVKNLFPIWPDGVNAEGNHVQGQYVQYKGQLYRIEQPTVKPIESQPPDGVGMLAVYRPVDNTHEGTLEDPIPWVYGMDCFEGKYYSYEGAVYYCKGDMKPCVWYPDGGAPQWEKVA